MAYKNNLLEYYGGGAVPNRQGYQEGGYMPSLEDYKSDAGYQGGGLMGNSLLGMQAGGGVDFSSLFGRSGGSAAVTRAIKIAEAKKDLLGKGKQIAKKGLFSGIGSILGQQFGKKVVGGGLAALLTPILGPAAAPIVAQMIAQGGGAYLGAKAGYGKAVKGLGSKGKWLARDYKKLGRAQLGEEAFKERGLAGGIWAGFEGLSDSDVLKNVGDKFKTKLGTLMHGESPVAGAGEALQASEAGQILSQDADSLTIDKFKSMRPEDPFEYARPTFESYGETISAAAPTQLDMPLRRAELDFTNYLLAPGTSGHLSGFGLPNVQQASFDKYGGKFADRYGSQEGGMVRDDTALLDMIYRR